MWQWRPFEELDDVDTIIASISDHQSDISAEESIIVASAVPSRVREFTAGRSLARILLSRRDIHPKSILAGAGGQPVWPADIRGSISHTASHVGATVASRDTCRGIGLDIELTGSASQIDQTLIMTPSEIEFAAGTSIADCATLLFCCKEAAFKAVFPVVGEEFEFRDVEVSINDKEFRVVTTETRLSSNVLASGRGYLASGDGLVATVFCVGNKGPGRG